MKTKHISVASNFIRLHALAKPLDSKLNTFH